MGEDSSAMIALRIPRSDGIFLVLAAIHGGVLLRWPSVGVIALGLWWNSNTVAHNFIHHPFFRNRVLNDAFSSYLSLLLGFPQRLWRDRHLAHHAEKPFEFRWSKQLIVEAAAVVGLWIVLLSVVPGFFIHVYLPGYLCGLVLCQLQGHYEHIRGPVSHYGAIYNWLFFNDGFHVEHHRRPNERWNRLPQWKTDGASTSRWPAVLRWLELLSLDSLEAVVLKSTRLQQFVVECHKRAFDRLLPLLPRVHRIGIVGGGLFPRTALICRQIWPDAHVAIIDEDQNNLDTAKAFLDGRAEFIHARYDTSKLATDLTDARPLTDSARFDEKGGRVQIRNGTNLDLLIIPLSFDGDRHVIYRHPETRAVLVHDWIWRRHKTSTIVSWFLLKRLNLVRE